MSWWYSYLLKLTLGFLFLYFISNELLHPHRHLNGRKIIAEAVICLIFHSAVFKVIRSVRTFFLSACALIMLIARLMVFISTFFLFPVLSEEHFAIDCEWYNPNLNKIKNKTCILLWWFSCLSRLAFLNPKQFNVICFQKLQLLGSNFCSNSLFYK